METMRNVSLFLLLGLLSALPYRLVAQVPTWSEQIAPIIFTHCTSCHRPGEIAPFSLTKYEEAVAWGGMISYVTDIRYMPPWKPDPSYGPKYLRENYLTDAEIALIRDWVDGGMPQGDPAKEPALPVFPDGSQIGTPDLVLSFAKSHLHPGNGVDEYRYFVLPTGLKQPRNLVALEMRPGNKQIVHHALTWVDSTGTAAANDAATPEYGYEGVKGGGAAFGIQLPGYVPGQSPHVYSQGIAQRVPANADLVVQMHYAPTTTDEPDSSVFNLFFTDKPVTRYVRTRIMNPKGGTLLNGPFFIPANQKREFHGVWTVPEEISMLGLFPHMHLLGTHWEVYGVTPANDTIHLIRIGDWDFNWQGSYHFRKMIRIPKGTVIHAFAGYDNTSDNPNNPNSPPKLVTWGEGTADEMYYLPLHFVPYLPGDEFIDLEDALSDTENPPLHFAKTRLYPVQPNPSPGGTVRIGYTLERMQPVRLGVYDLNGRAVALLAHGNAMPGEHVAEWDSSGLPAGMYCIVLEADGQVHTRKLLLTGP